MHVCRFISNKFSILFDFKIKEIENNFAPALLHYYIVIVKS